MLSENLQSIQHCFKSFTKVSSFNPPNQVAIIFSHFPDKETEAHRGQFFSQSLFKQQMFKTSFTEMFLRYITLIGLSFTRPIEHNVTDL